MTDLLDPQGQAMHGLVTAVDRVEEVKPIEPDNLRECASRIWALAELMDREAA